MGAIDTRFALMLAMVNGVGPARYKSITDHFKTYDELLAKSSPGVFSEIGLNDSRVSGMMRFDRWEKVDDILAKAELLGIDIICLGQDGYPEELANIYSPPVVLYLKGQSEAISRPAVAVVGSRTPTPYGREMTQRIVADLASRGFTIISGLAWGIDAEAHRAALDAGGRTAAVFGSGIDIVYPADHRELAERMLEQGFWVSEFPFGTKPEKFNFPRRNRIISGLAQAVVVVEAGAKSGALVTAHLAAEQGKDVFAVPGRADNPMSSGTISLIKEGAAIATSAEDILAALGWQISKNVTAQAAPPVQVKLEPDEQKVCDLVSKGPAQFDELVRDLELPSSRISSILLKLELAGVVVRRPGNYISRA